MSTPYLFNLVKKLRLKLVKKRVKQNVKFKKYNVTVICKLHIKQPGQFDKQEIILINEDIKETYFKEKVESEIDKLELKFKTLINRELNPTNNSIIQDYKGNFFSVIDIWNKIEKYEMLVIYNDEENILTDEVNTFEMESDFITVTCKLIINIKNVYNYDEFYFINEFFQDETDKKQEIVLIKETFKKKESQKEIEKEIKKVEDKFKALISNQNNTTNSLLLKSKYNNQFYSLVDIWDKIEKYLMEITYP